MHYPFGAPNCVRACYFSSLLLLLALTAGCSATDGEGSLASRAVEVAFCSTPREVPSAIVVVGAAAYTKRLAVSGGLSATESAPFPIRYAEVQVLDQSGSAVQCAVTDSQGNFNLRLPKNTGPYTLQINSRGSNSHVVASVTDAPDTARYYSLTTTVTTDQDQSLPALVAHATGEILGGAFNIFDDIVKANEFLITNTSSCGEYWNDCQSYVPTYKCSVFWKKGFNPANYLGSSSGLSFYLPGTSELYILGGKNGDTDNSDTDHFDDSVIIHEYGHFIEDHYGRTNSPGGFHSATHIIDPRLAWGEGWADFFSSAVLNRSTYIDTCGNLSGSPCGSSGYLFNVDVSGPAFDFPSARVGEGNFHELSITSTFFNFLTIGQSSYNEVAPRFNELWATFTGPFKDQAFGFRNFGLFMQLHDTILQKPTSLAKELSVRYQRPDQSDYATPVSASGHACTYTSTYGNSNLFSDPRVDWLQNNDVYQFSISSPGAYEFSLARVSGQINTDVDLYIYGESHTYIYEGNCGWDGLCFSSQGLIAKNVATDTVAGGNVRLTANLVPGRYLIMVNFAGNQTGSGTDNKGSGTLTYSLSMNGVPLCSQ